jgi:hypothetical protein
LSTTTKAVLDEARRILRDPDNGRPVIASDTIRQAIDRCVPEVADSCALERTRADIITTVAGTATYTFGSASPQPEYTCIDCLTLKGASPAAVEKLSPERLYAIKNLSNTGSGRPQYWCAEPQSDQTVRITFWPTPDAVETVEAVYNSIPEAWGTGAGTPPTVPFSRRAVRALELKVAATVAAALNAEDLNALKLNANVVGLWQLDAAELLRLERLAVSRLRVEHGPTNVAWLMSWRRS